MYSVARSPPREPGARPSSRSLDRNLTCARMRSPETSVICAEARLEARKAITSKAIRGSRSVRFIRVLVPKSLFDLGKADLTGQAQVLAILTRSQLRHRRGSLAGGIAGPNAVLLHIAMVARSGRRQRAGD